MNLLTEEAGKYLSDNLQSKIHTSRYNDAFQMVDEMLQDLEDKDKVVLKEPWQAYIRRLEARIEKLEKQLAVKKALTTK
jgi:polyhydroxyalkanoate synthesis regulator phasin